MTRWTTVGVIAAVTIGTVHGTLAALTDALNRAWEIRR